MFWIALKLRNLLIKGLHYDSQKDVIRKIHTDGCKFHPYSDDSQICNFCLAFSDPGLYLTFYLNQTWILNRLFILNVSKN